MSFSVRVRLIEMSAEKGFRFKGKNDPLSVRLAWEGLRLIGVRLIEVSLYQYFATIELSQQRNSVTVYHTRQLQPGFNPISSHIAHFYIAHKTPFSPTHPPLKFYTAKLMTSSHYYWL